MAKAKQDTRTQASAQDELFAKLNATLTGIGTELKGIRSDMGALGARVAELESNGNADTQARVEQPPFVQDILSERAQADAGDAQADSLEVALGMQYIPEDVGGHARHGVIMGQIHEGEIVVGRLRKALDYGGKHASKDSVVSYFTDALGRDSYRFWADDGKSARLPKDMAENKGLVAPVHSPARQLAREARESAQEAKARVLGKMTKDVVFPAGTEVVLKYNGKTDKHVPMMQNADGDWSIVPKGVKVVKGKLAQDYVQTRKVSPPKATRGQVRRIADHVFKFEDGYVTADAKALDYQPVPCTCSETHSCPAVRKFGVANPLAS